MRQYRFTCGGVEAACRLCGGKTVARILNVSGNFQIHHDTGVSQTIGLKFPDREAWMENV